MAMCYRLLVFVLFIQCIFSLGNFVSSSTVDVPGQLNECYIKPGDLNLGIVTPIRSPGDTFEFCQEDSVSSVGVQILEAYIYAVERVNQNPDILPGITLGYVALDDCFWDMGALAKSLYFLPVEGASGDVRSVNCSVGFQQFAVEGVVGISNSRKAVMVSSLLSVFHIPILGTLATSDELSDKSRFEYFLRVVAPDRLQAEAILDFVQYYQWTYVSLLYSEGSYGENGAKLIEKGIKTRGICIAYAKLINSGSDKNVFHSIIKHLIQVKSAKAVILFVSYEDAIQLYQAVEATQTQNMFIWLGTDAIGVRDLIPGANGTISLKPRVGQDPGFDQYYLSLTPSQQPDNPWLPSLWAKLHGCEWGSELLNTSCQRLYNSPVPPQSLFSLAYKSVDAVYAYAQAMNDTINLHCSEAFLDKSLLKGCVTGERLLRSMKNISLAGVTGRIKFDENGDMVAQYEFVQHLFHDSQRMFVVASWDADSDNIDVDDDAVDWSPFLGGDNGTGVNGSPESVCSKPCGKDEYTVRMELPCCWDCRTCRKNEIMINNKSACNECPANTWPDVNTTTVCEDIPPTFIQLSDSVALALIILSTLGIICWGTTLTLYVVNWDVKLVKASSRELSCVIMTGILLAYIGAMVLLWRPQTVSCYFRYFMFNFSVALIFSPLLVKTNRVYRIFSAGKKGKKPPWIGSTSQTVITISIILVQVTISVITAVVIPPEPKLRMRVPTEKLVELFCELPLQGFLVPVAYNLIIIVMCALYGFLARKLPENFNESWYIFVSVSTTTFLWVVFLPMYFTTFYAHHQVVLLGFCLDINASVTLLCLYIPKFYAIYYVDEDVIKLAGSVNSTIKVAPSPGTNLSVVTD